MPHYHKSTTELIKDYFQEIDLQSNQTFEKKDITNWFDKNYPKIKSNTVSCHLAKLSVNNPSRRHTNPNKNGSDDILFKLSKNTFRLYNKANDILPDIDIANGEINDYENIDEEKGMQEFAYEKDLRNYLVKNLSMIESGLKLYEDEGITGIEYEVDGRFIDVLAVDKDNNFVVIELKVSRGYDRVIGQLLRYKNWIKKNLAEEGQNVRGIIICKQLTEDLLLACLELKDVELFEYELWYDYKLLFYGKYNRRKRGRWIGGGKPIPLEPWPRLRYNC
ncbi:MAG: endonuclease NucS [Fibromonadaceae bacterium]|jgi:hypothetical protein|nr:endonuclease NucS [Fibromonadaceae bacterium]